MKIGSLVECVHDFKKRASDETPPKKGKIYTIREIILHTNLFTKEKTFAITLEEIINPVKNYIDAKSEVYFPIKYFREIELPPDLEEEIQECLERELVLV